jgi:S1-C subfamily serine protease
MCKLREWCKSLKSFCTHVVQRFLPAKELSLIDVNTLRTTLRKPWHGSWMTSDTVKRKMPLKPATLSVFSRLERLAKLLGGIPVWEVFPDSGAAQAGVRFGDIILRVNGTKTPTFELFLEAGEKHLDRLEFEVFRNGKLLRLQTDATAMPAPSPH